jgi:hypothetical protein
MKFLRWLAEFFEDPKADGPSMARACAFIFAWAAVVGVFRGTEAAVIVALVGGGTVALLTRAKAE